MTESQVNKLLEELEGIRRALEILVELAEDELYDD